MKEILKYLRQAHSFTQDEVAKRLGISRQSYIKYEKGLVSPPAKVISQLADLYQVSETFIYRNEIPLLSTEKIPQETLVSVSKDYIYEIGRDFGQLIVTDSGQPRQKQPKTYEAYFDGTSVRVLTNEGFRKGQKFMLVEVDDNESEKKRQALETIMKYVGGVSSFSDKNPEDDPLYKEALYEALVDKYGSAN